MSLLRLDTRSVTEVTIFYVYAYLLVCDPVAIMDYVFYDIILFCKSWTILMIKTYVKMIQGKKQNKTKTTTTTTKTATTWVSEGKLRCKTNKQKQKLNKQTKNLQQQQQQNCGIE